MPMYLMIGIDVDDGAHSVLTKSETSEKALQHLKEQAGGKELVRVALKTLSEQEEKELTEYDDKHYLWLKG